MAGVIERAKCEQRLRTGSRERGELLWHAVPAQQHRVDHSLRKSAPCRVGPGEAEHRFHLRAKQVETERCGEIGARGTGGSDTGATASRQHRWAADNDGGAHAGHNRDPVCHVELRARIADHPGDRRLAGCQHRRQPIRRAARLELVGTGDAIGAADLHPMDRRVGGQRLLERGQQGIGPPVERPVAGPRHKQSGTFGERRRHGGRWRGRQGSGPHRDGQGRQHRQKAAPAGSRQVGHPGPSPKMTFLQGYPVVGKIRCALFFIRNKRLARHIEPLAPVEEGQFDQCRRGGTTAPTRRSNAMPAAIVPPVASRSSTTTTRWPGSTASACTSTRSVPYSSE